MAIEKSWNTYFGSFRYSALDDSHKVGVHTLGHQLFEQCGKMRRRFREFDDRAAPCGHCTKLMCKCKTSEYVCFSRGGMVHSAVSPQRGLND